LTVLQTSRGIGFFLRRLLWIALLSLMAGTATAAIDKENQVFGYWSPNGNCSGVDAGAVIQCTVQTWAGAGNVVSSCSETSRTTTNVYGQCSIQWSSGQVSVFNLSPATVIGVYISWGPGCPLNSVSNGPTTCTCNAGYMDDTSKKSCVPSGGAVQVEIFNSSKSAKSCNYCPIEVGKPIAPLEGVETHTVQTGLSLGGQPLLVTYDNRKVFSAASAGLTPATFGNTPSFGALWESSLHKNLKLGVGGFGAQLMRGDGKVINFRFNSPTSSYISSGEVNDKLEVISGEYRFTSDRAIETYNPAGRLVSVADMAGNTLAYTYSTAASAAAPDAGYITRITDNTGRFISFQYILPAGGNAKTDGMISAMTDVAGRAISVAYDASKNLQSITWADGKVRTYVYENGALPWALTGMVDERGIRYFTLGYDSAGRAISTELAAGVNKYTVSYTAPPTVAKTQTYDANSQVTVITHDMVAPTGVVLTLPNGQTSNVSAATVQGSNKHTGMSQSAGSGSAASSDAATFDANGNVLSRDDFQGARTCFVYDSKNQETARIEGLANNTACASVTPANATLPSGARKILTYWHPDWRIPIAISAPGSLVNSVYHGQPDPFNGSAPLSCTSAPALPNGKPMPLLCKQVTRAIWGGIGPSGIVTDPSKALNSLLLHADTSLVDSSNRPKPMTAYDGAAVSTANKVSGKGSLYLPGNVGAAGGYLSTPAHADFVVGTQEFTVEAWVYPTELTGIRTISTRQQSNGAIFQFWLNNGAPALRLRDSSGSQFTTYTGSPIAAGVWSHLAVSRKAGVLYFFVNGSLVSQAASTQNLTPGATDAFVIGASWSGTAYANFFAGYIDEFRFTSGLGRYSSAFTPSTKAFDDGYNTYYDTSASTVVNSFTYDTAGRMLTSKDSLNRTTIFAYYAAASFSGTAPNETGHAAGDLQAITNAAGHVTQFTLYDKAGRVRQMIDPKGVVTDIAYTPRGWTSSVVVTPPGGVARINGYSYDDAGQLTGAGLPDGTTLGYSYDAAQRLVGMTDAKGNSVTYTLDNMGNRVGEQVKDPGGTLQRNISRIYDALNRVQQFTGASN
jgi:YD repeat-containing protein